jgi:tetratricopeptide (TPR) repeat protein
MAAAGLWTTAEDLARFAIDVQNTYKGVSQSVLSQDMVKKMLTPFVAEFVGLGLFIEDHDGDVYFGHGGWDEGFSSQMTAHRDKGYGVVVLTNSNHPSFIEELIRSVAFTYRWSNFVPEYGVLLLEPAQFANIVGRYRHGEDDVITVYAEGNRLFRRYIRGDVREMFRIDDSTYVSRESTELINFATNPADGKLHIILRDPGEAVQFEHPRMAENEHVPFEYLVAGDFDAALTAYKALKDADDANHDINEGNLNNQGYNLLNNQKYDLAKFIFKINMTLYPNSANVYDSYAEACMVSGDTAQAIQYYKKTLAMEPNNPNAVKMLEKLRR